MSPRLAAILGLAAPVTFVTGIVLGDLAQPDAFSPANDDISDLGALTASASNVAMVPVFLAALLVVRGLPAVVYRRVLDGPHTAIAGIMQATSLPFIVAATAIGMDLGLIDAAASAALIGAGLLSVLVFPVGGLALLRRAAAPAADVPQAPAPRPAAGMAGELL